MLKKAKEGDTIILKNGNIVSVSMLFNGGACTNACYFAFKYGSCERALTKLMPNLNKYRKVHSWRNKCFLDYHFYFRYSGNIRKGGI